MRTDMSEIRPVFIYGLTEPNSDEIRYIGKSVRPLERFRNHINEKPSNCHRSHWLQSLAARGEGRLTAQEMSRSTNLGDEGLQLFENRNHPTARNQEDVA